MVPDSFVAYFAASIGASAALTGLLFVAISLAPERTVGPQSSAERRSRAGSAFMAFLDVFFLSLIALIPGVNLGDPALLIGVFGLFNTVSLGRHFWQGWREDHQLGGATLLLGSLALYLLQIWYALPLVVNPHATHNVTALAYLLIGGYAIGLARSWDLLGAQHEGLLTLLDIGRKAEAVPDQQASGTADSREQSVQSSSR